MNKQEFLMQLRRGLAGLPQEEIEDRLTFYAEMIEDRMEEGLTEEQAVAAAGMVEEIVAQIVAEIPLAKIAKERIKPKRALEVWEIILLIVGSPLWISLGAAVLAVMVAVYVSLWSVIISLWSAFAAVVGCAFCGILAGGGFAFGGHLFAGLAMLGAGLVLAGLAILLFFGCNAATAGIILLTEKFALWVKNCFIKKEDAS